MRRSWSGCLQGQGCPCQGIAFRHTEQIVDAAIESDLDFLALCSNPQFRNRELGFLFLFFFVPFPLSSKSKVSPPAIRLLSLPILLATVHFGHLSTEEAVLIGERGYCLAPTCAGNDASSNLRKGRKKTGTKQN